MLKGTRVYLSYYNICYYVGHGILVTIIKNYSYFTCISVSIENSNQYVHAWNEFLITNYNANNALAPRTESVWMKSTRDKSSIYYFE